jgi:transcriptional regulator with GAF, ATPase, and Fis domain
MHADLFRAVCRPAVYNLRALSGNKAVAKTIPTAEKLREVFSRMGFVTTCRNMDPVLHCAYKAALVSDTTVLLQGETGTGKQVLARAIHSLDQKRCRFAFVTVHCSTVTETLAESELFGHRKGSFSGADVARGGLFQAADKGTIFLDDINDLPLRLQPKLLDALQRGIIRALGSDREIAVDVRVIAAANQPLEPMVDAGAFRSDLYHRLNVIQLRLPPLRERTEDVAALVLEFVRRHSHLHDGIASLDADLVDYLQSCPFDGNVRELENAVQRMLFNKVEGDSLSRADWCHQQMPSPAESKHEDAVRQAANLLWSALSQQAVPFRELMRRIEGELLQKALQIEGKTRREIASMLHTSERTLYHKISSHRSTETGEGRAAS